MGRAVLLAGAACHTGAAAAAAWLGARDLRQGDRLPRGLLLPLLADRDPAWLGDVAHRLAARASTAEDDYPVVRELVRMARAEVPLTDGYVRGWAGAERRGGLLRELRTDPQTPLLVPRLFETAELARPLAWTASSESADSWPRALVALAAEGVVARSLLVDAAVARLLRGGRPADLKFFLVLVERLELTAEEERAHTADWVGMAADAPSTVAARAQQALARLAEAGELPARTLAEASAALLFRTEKKLVRAQLTLLGKVLRREPGSAAELLPAVAEAFGHEDTTVQERALKLVARHARDVDADVLAELAGAAALLSPAHQPAAADVFGADVVGGGDAPYEEVLPPLPVPRPLGPPLTDLAELVEEVALHLRSDSAFWRDSAHGSVADVERILDGLVRQAHRDRAALARELDEIASHTWWYRRAHGPGDELGPVASVVAALTRAEPGEAVAREYRAKRQDGPRCVHEALARIPAARAREAAARVVTDAPPFLLATPTWHTGALDARELVDRLRGYAERGVEPGPVDFAQALLRVRRGQPEAAAEAARIGTREGGRLAAWLAGDDPAPPALRRISAPDDPARTTWSWRRPGTARVVLETRERLAFQRDMPRSFHWLGRPHSPTSADCHHWFQNDAHWLAVLPYDREYLAAWLLSRVTATADAEWDGGTTCLLPLAEGEAGVGDGPAGPALHLALATGFGARRADDRLVAVDALLVLAVRGQLDVRVLGAELAELVRLGTVKPNRLADALRTAAATGAYATVGGVLGSTLPVLLAGDSPVRGLGEILAVAADCAERSGSPGPLPGLAEAAARRGGSQLVVQARRLLNATGQYADHRTAQTEEINS
ncbi:DUF6493 family protein [Streptomyces sp. NPDC001941]|uniref:DUF6493 family protein n=1 Tax=Streptomyces sp. NPDC001941 TaxID=3154659 RepID=UPI00332597D8